MSSSNEGKPQTAAAPEVGVPERRRSLRFPFSASIEVTETKSGAKVVGRTSDLGLGGCYVDAISPFPVGTEAHVRIKKGEECFEAQSKVVYSQIGMGMGLSFVSAQPKHYRLFQRWLKEISGVEHLAADVPIRQEEEPIAAGSANEEAGDETSNVLNELLIALIRKRILTEEEGKAMLRRLHR